ncbi:hypothetical protein [Sphingomonas sp.]|uniref:hypothetical protein n=1 Tax=Sphingomonas sp. TaxID=28214 RepID=UPI001857310C|nr:hypothetical protein [Sphingomonas sp.]MBA3511012.1 hypothetical protein [Sphingomonas sp.]
MARLSISKAWDETRALLSRNGKLMTTVAAAMFLLPQVIVGVITGQGTDASETAPALGLPIFLIAAIIGVVGQLAIAWLAIGTGISVGESIRHGLRRTLPFIGAFLLMIAAFVIFFVIAAGLLMALGVVDATVAQPRPGDVIIILLIMLVPMLFVAVRMLPSVAVAVATAEPQGPIGILRRSWTLTSGHFGRLLGFFLVFVLAALIVAVTVTLVSGLLVSVLFGSTEPFSIGALVLSLLVGLLQVALILVYVVMIARIYVQLAGGGAAEASVPTTGS